MSDPVPTHAALPAAVTHPSGYQIELPEQAGALAALAVPSSDQRRRTLVLTLTTAWLLAKRSQHTRACYRRDLRAWLCWCASRGIDPLAARMADVDLWIAAQRRGEAEALGEAGANGAATARGAAGEAATFDADDLPAPAESSIARRVSAISSWYAYLLTNTCDRPESLLANNPARSAARPRVDPDYSPTVGLSTDEARRLRAEAQADGPTAATLIGLLLVTGLRVGSLLQASVADLGHDRGHRVLDVHTKRGGRRRTVIPPGIGGHLDAMLAERGDPETGPLFVTASGTPMYQMAVYRLVRRLARRAGIATAEQLSPHSLRHTAITELLDASGGDLRRAQDFAGHADPRTTRRYDRARNNLDQHGAYLLASRFTED